MTFIFAQQFLTFTCLLTMLTCFTDKDINILQQNINELRNVSLWLCSNKLSLNIEKSNCYFSSPAKKTYLGFPSNFRKQVLESGKVY